MSTLANYSRRMKSAADDNASPTALGAGGALAAGGALGTAYGHAAHYVPAYSVLHEALGGEAALHKAMEAAEAYKPTSPHAYIQTPAQHLEHAALGKLKKRVNFQSDLLKDRWNSRAPPGPAGQAAWRSVQDAANTVMNHSHTRHALRGAALAGGAYGLYKLHNWLNPSTPAAPPPPVQKTAAAPVGSMWQRFMHHADNAGHVLHSAPWELAALGTLQVPTAYELYHADTPEKKMIAGGELAGLSMMSLPYLHKMVFPHHGLAEQAASLAPHLAKLR